MKKTLKAIAAVMLSMAMVFAVGCKPDNESDDGDDNGGGGGNDTPTIVDNGGNGSLNGHDYIDLGLPSGTLWATCNVGAGVPEANGGHFSWAETVDKTDHVDQLNWVGYQYSAAETNSEKRLTKYCSVAEYGNNGFTDELTALQPSDDAATVNWGEGWMMPSVAQFEELMEVCSGTRTYLNEVEGFQFTSPNGQSIFLPLAGRYMGDSYWSYMFTRGEYWTRELNVEYPYSAKIFGWDAIGYANDDDFMQSGCYRCYGISVRPVCMAH